MKSFAPRNVLAVLRKIAGIGQKELAEIVGRSPRTIQAVEINRLPLSEELGQRIAFETSVSLKWLLNGDISVPPYVHSTKGPGGVPYTKGHFERTRALILANKEPYLSLVIGEESFDATFKKGGVHQQALQPSEDETFPLQLLALQERCLRTLHAAGCVGRMELAVYRLEKFLSNFMNEFGQKFDAEYLEAAETFYRRCSESIGLTRNLITATSQDKYHFWSPFVKPEDWVPAKLRMQESRTQITLPDGMSAEEALARLSQSPELMRLGVRIDSMVTMTKGNPTAGDTPVPLRATYVKKKVTENNHENFPPQPG